MLRKLTVLSALFLLFTLLATIQVGAVGVRPLVVDLELRPGDTGNFELILSPAEQQETVNLELYKPTQLITGGLTYEFGDPELYAPVGWVELDESQVIVPPGESTTVSGKVTVPFDTGGSYTIVIMVEPAVDEAATGITFRVRYAVRLNIVVDRPGIRPRAEIVSYDLAPDDEGKPILSAHFRNTSAMQYPVSAEVTVRDSTRRLIERVSLKTQSAQQSGQETTRVYPGAEVLLSGEITEPLFPDDYEMRLFVRYADLQMIDTKKTTITGDEFTLDESIAVVRVSPETIEATLRPGGAASEVIEVENRLPENLKIALSAQEMDSKYAHSIFSNLEVQTRGAQQFELEPRRSSRTVLTIRAPRDVEPGGYYGYLDVHAFDAEEEHLDTYSIPLSMMVGDGWDYLAEIISLHAADVEENEYLLSVAIQNSSVAHIIPRGTLYLKDHEGVILKTLQLHLQEGMHNVLPNRVGFMTANVMDVEPGEYIADIRLDYLDEEIGVAELPVSIGLDEEE